MLKRLIGVACTVVAIAVIATASAEAQCACKSCGCKKAPAAATKNVMPKGETATIVGTVIDISCKFGQGLQGDSHRMCSEVCADRGIPLGILTDDGKLYIPTTAAMPGEGQNGRLKPFAEQKVRVSGKVFPAGGAHAIQIEQIRKS